MDVIRTGADFLKEERNQRVDDVVACIPAHSGATLTSTVDQDTPQDTGTLERKTRAGTHRANTSASGREDISEVEYRQARLEKVVLADLRTMQSEEEAESSLCELAALAEAVGSRVFDNIIQRRMRPDPVTYLGSGEARELADIMRSVKADTVAVDEGLAPSQRRGLENIVDAKAVDRTVLVLNTLAQHTESREGEVQAELARFEYLLPRLCGWNESMSRQTGDRVAGSADIGSRDPGETKIELDHRHIHTRMAKLRASIARMEPVRRTQRNSRRRGAVPSVTVAGYINVGKSMLSSHLTDTGVLVQDALFATLGPAVRRTRAADGCEYTLTDAIGFMRNLPTRLVETFRSTLGEVGQANIVVHVVDAAHPDPVSQAQVMRSVIGTIEDVSEIPKLTTLSKVDLASPERIVLLYAVFPDAAPLSAHTSWGVKALRAVLEDMLPRPRMVVSAVLPYSTGSFMHRVHEEGDAEREEYVEAGTRTVVRVDEVLAAVIVRETMGGIVGDAAVSGE